MNELTKEQLAAERMDWQQVVLNGGPPCFALMEDGHFCGRAQRWEGHSDEKVEFPHHKFISLADLLASEALRLREAGGQYDTCLAIRDKQIADLTAKLALLRKVYDASCKLSVRLKYIHTDPHYLSVWQSYQFHGGNYSNGPKYEQELANLCTAIDSVIRKEKNG